MLQVPADFPMPGSHAFVEGSGEEVRIIQRNADGTCLLQRMARAYNATERAAGNFTLPLAQLHATETAAVLGPARPRRRKTNRRGAPGKRRV